MFKNQPIRRKLAFLTLGATIFALLLALAGFSIYERASFRTSAVTELKALADTLGANAMASLTFRDRKTATEILSALRAEPHILAARLYDDQGQSFAEYRRSDLPANFPMPAWKPEGTQFDSQSFTLVRPVMFNGEEVGSIVILSDLRAFRNKLRQYGQISAVVLLVSILITHIASSRLLRIVSDPIVRLAELAGQVSREQDYSLRAVSGSQDETGTLVSSFNQMLEGIQQRDQALQAAKDELEARVLQRTSELQREVLERKEAEAEMRRARDAAEVASRAKSEFLANMSHEIRTPLNGVIGMTDLALDSQPAAEMREYLETIKVSADSLLGVINDILDFSKIEAGKMDLDSVDFNLRDCLEESLKPLALRADEKGIELLCDIHPDIPEHVRGDSSRLRQIVLNLVGNAVKFTPKGEVALRVEMDGEKQGDVQRVRFTVADTGIGISPEKRQSIFEPFTQADTSTTRQYGGTGLGLTISARLVTMMGGKIWFESEPGRGSQFHFTVPLICRAHKVEPEALIPVELLQGMRVLIVDDNRTNGRILKGILRGWQMRTHEVEGGESAMAELISARARGDAYQLILTDMHMPAMDGFQLVEKIRHVPGLSATPIMMLSSARHREDAERCRRLGISSYLLKPIRKRELLAAILKALGPLSTAVAGPSTGRSAAAGGALHILLAEDNTVNQTVARRILEKLGHSIIIANNGREALSVLADQNFDLVLMDIQMPEMDGFRATASIRANEKQTNSHLPIIAMTAHAMKGDRERCLEAGMDGYVSKPIDARELKKAINLVTGHAGVAPTSMGEDAAPNPSSMWNPAQMLERLGGDQALFQEVVEIFLKEAPKTLAQLHEAIRRGNAEAVQKAAHSLKGELGYLGIPDASQKARELEEMGRQQDLGRAAGLFPQLEADIAVVLTEMRDRIQGPEQHFARGAGQ